MATPKFKTGDHVNHPAGTDTNGVAFPAGTGTITQVANPPKGDVKYQVKCDATGTVLSYLFPEADLTAA